MCFGSPQIRGVSTDAIASLVRAGEDFGTVADEYGLSRHEVVDALHCTCIQEVVDTFGDPAAVRLSWCPVHSAGGGERSDIRKGGKEYETALLRQRYHDLRAAVIRDGLPNLVARIEAAELRTQCDE